MNSVMGYLVDNPSTTQLLLYATIMISMWWTEKAILDQSVSIKWRHTSINGAFILSALPIQIVIMILCVRIANWNVHYHWGILYLFPGPESAIMKYGLMFVMLDFLDYVYHFSMHRVSSFWRFHLVHHTDQVLDVSTTVREHPGETLLRISFLTVWVFICGASVEVLILRQAVETVSNILSHTTFRLPTKWGRIVGWIFITPNLHQAHHHFQMPATNCNYGDVFSIWDRLFGTLMHLAREDTVFGLDTHMEQRSLAGHYLCPIERKLGVSP